MNKKLLAGGAVVLATIGVAVIASRVSGAPPQPPPPPSNRANLYGRVSDPEGRPIGLAAVAFSGVETTTVTTDQQGNYLVPNLSLGAAIVTVTKPGYTSTTVPVTLVAGNNRLDIKLVPTTVSRYIAGRVFEPDGMTGLNDVDVWLSGTLVSTTDTAGDYGTGELAAGTYSLTFTKLGYQTLTVQASVTEGRTDLNVTMQTLEGGVTIGPVVWEIMPPTYPSGVNTWTSLTVPVTVAPFGSDARVNAYLFSDTLVDENNQPVEIGSGYYGNLSGARITPNGQVQNVPITMRLYPPTGSGPSSGTLVIVVSIWDGPWIKSQNDPTPVAIT